MKKIAVLLACSIGSLSVYGMQPEEERKLYVENQFPDEILLAYVTDYSEKEPRSMNLAAGSTRELPNWKDIKQFFIKPYGQIKGKITWQTVGLSSHDYHLELQQQARQLALLNPKMDLKLIVSPLYPFLKKASPYKVAIATTEKIEPKVPVERRLTSAFDKVMDALEKGQEILPRYVLGVSPGANEKDIDTAYNQLIAHWEPMTASSNLQDAAYGRKVIEAIKVAYAALVKEIEVARAKEALDRQLAQTMANFQEYSLKNFHTFTRFPEQ